MAVVGSAEDYDRAAGGQPAAPQEVTVTYADVSH
jgi:hypothetical protein